MPVSGVQLIHQATGLSVVPLTQLGWMFCLPVVPRAETATDFTTRQTQPGRAAMPMRHLQLRLSGAFAAAGYGCIHGIRCTCSLLEVLTQPAQVNSVAAASVPVQALLMRALKPLMRVPYGHTLDCSITDKAYCTVTALKCKQQTRHGCHRYTPDCSITW